jgi:hypothetical protein
MLKVSRCVDYSPTQITIGWTKVMHNMLLDAIKTIFVSATFIDICLNNVTTIDNILWLSIHLCMVQVWKKIPILLCVETTSVSTTSNDTFSSMVNVLLDFGGLGCQVG